MAAFAGAVVLVLRGAADDGEAIKRMPWRVILMVCGVTVLIALLEKAQGIDLHRVAGRADLDRRHRDRRHRASSPASISVYSSTSGVVLPAFLPTVPGLAQQLGVPIRSASPPR